MASMTLGVAQADDINTHELFDYLQSGDENSIQNDETVELSSMEFKDAVSASRHIHEQSIEYVFNTITSD